MKVTKTSKLVVKGSFGAKTMEVLKITKDGIEARDVAQTGLPVFLTGFNFYGIAVFWKMVEAGAIQIV